MLIRTQPLTPVDDPLHVLCAGTDQYKPVDCWRVWWQRPENRQMEAVMSVAIDSDVAEDTLRDYVRWLRALGADARLCVHESCVCAEMLVYAEDGFGAETHYCRYAIDVAYGPDSNAARTFVIWNIVRFLLVEHIGSRKDLREPMSAKDYIAALFSRKPRNTNHMPFTDMAQYLYGSLYYTSGRDFRWQESMGEALARYFEYVLSRPDWSSTPMKRASLSQSNLSFGDFISWLSENSIIESHR